jgi:hypothetical protein
MILVLIAIKKILTTETKSNQDKTESISETTIKASNFQEAFEYNNKHIGIDFKIFRCLDI